MALHFPRRRIGMLCASLLCAASARAASFDCARAASPFEHAVCADARLSATDALLAQRYGAALAQLSDAGKRIVQDGQRQWLRYARTLCIGHPTPQGTTQCLQDAYDERLKDLKLAAVRVGPYLFSRIDFYEAANPDEQGMLSKGRIAVPRIDAPSMPAAVEWNAAMARLQASRGHTAGCDGPSGDYAFDYSIGGATRSTISIVTSDWIYCHGTAHGYGGYRSVNYATEPALRVLKAAELFRPDTGWTAFLVDRAVHAIQKVNGPTSVDPKALEQAVRAPGAWAIDGNGLVITISMLDVGAGPGVANVAVPWADLQPYLSAEANRLRQ